MAETFLDYDPRRAREGEEERRDSSEKKFRSFILYDNTANKLNEICFVSLNRNSVVRKVLSYAV